MFRLIIGLILSILLLVFILQNNSVVTLHFLIWNFVGSLALILLLTAIITLIAAFLVVLPFMIKKKLVKSPVETKIPEKTV